MTLKDLRKRKVQSHENKKVSREETVVLIQSFIKRFSSETVLKCTVTIDFAELITGPEKPTAENIQLHTEYARQLLQKLNPQLAIEVEHFF